MFGVRALGSVLRAVGPQLDWSRRNLAIVVCLGVLAAFTDPNSMLAQVHLTTVQGRVWFDRNRDGQRDPDEPLLAKIHVVAEQNGQPIEATWSADGTYQLRMEVDHLPIKVTVRALQLPGYRTPNGGEEPPSLLSAARTVTLRGDQQEGVDLGLVPAPVAHDERYFALTRYRIDHDTIWEYFQAHGGVATFGYPISRTFPFQGLWTQLFQRQLLQIDRAGQVRGLSLLDPNWMLLERGARQRSINGAIFPGLDRQMVAATQGPLSTAPSATQAGAVSRYLGAMVPDLWNGQPVRFLETYLQALPEGSPEERLQAAVEIWGLPVSRPTPDPHNPQFIYQRFQRGILHYDAAHGVTWGILLGDALKDVVTGQVLAPDLAENIDSSPYWQLYDPSQVDALAKGAQTRLQLAPISTNLALAFFPG
jgi:hypothetical protein